MTPWTVACQAPLSMGSSRQDIGGGCHFLLRGIFPTQETQVSCTAGRFFTNLKECESAFRLPHPPLRISGSHCSPGHLMGIILPSSVETRPSQAASPAQVLTEQVLTKCCRVSRGTSPGQLFLSVPVATASPQLPWESNLLTSLFLDHSPSLHSF